MGTHTQIQCFDKVVGVDISKASIRSSVGNKGVIIPSGTPLSGYSEYIDEIEGSGDFQTKNYSITSNGSTSITPDANYDGISGGTITVNIPTPSPSLQQKTATATTNGTVTYSADSGYDGISTISVSTNVTGSVSNNIIRKRSLGNFANFNEIGWDEESQADFQVNGGVVNWSPLNNSAHTISSANTAIYGVINDENRRSYASNSNMVYLPYFETSGVTEGKSYFSGFSFTYIPKLDTSNMTTMGGSGNAYFGMFSKCTNLKTVPKLNTSNVTDMAHMFAYASNLLSVPKFDTSNVTNMNGMFFSASRIKTIPQFNTSNVTNMETFVASGSSIEYIPPLNTSNVTNMNSICFGCPSLKKIGGWDMSNVNNLGSNAFYSCSGLTSFSLSGSLNITMEITPSPLDEDSCKSILAAASRTTNTNSKTLALKSGRTIHDDAQGTYQTMLETCISKGWTIQGLTIVAA